MHSSTHVLRSAGAIIAACILASTACASRNAPASTRPAAASDRASTGTAAHLRDRLQTVLDSLHRTGRAPGISAGLAFADGSSLGVAAGWSDTAARTPLRPDHLLLQGSVGKTYVAAVALQLVAEGRLRLDAPIATYLGRELWFDRLPNARAITVRMLMNHTSGLVRYEFTDAFTRHLTAAPDRVWRPQELLAYVFDTAAPFAAGTKWDYSDTNYIVLGMILERITGQPYYAEMRRRLLEPFDLRRTVPSDTRRIPGLAQGYAGPRNPFGGADAMIAADGRFSINPQFEWTGGGIASTPEDLARWARELYEGRALTPALRAEMLRGVPAPLGPPGTTYGLGVIIRPTASGTSYGHSGFFPGYSTDLMYFPENRLAVAVQINTSTSGAVTPSPGRVIAALVQAVRGARPTR